MAGKSVLDIGAGDGKYSFEAGRVGASRVVALDHYGWRLDGLRKLVFSQCHSINRHVPCGWIWQSRDQGQGACAAPSALQDAGSEPASRLLPDRRARASLGPSGHAGSFGGEAFERSNRGGVVAV